MRLAPVALFLAGCTSPPTGAALVELPQLRVVAPPAIRGDLVQLELINTTSTVITLPPPVCTGRLDQFSRNQWLELPGDAGPCVGLPIMIAPDEHHLFGFPTLESRPGTFRVVLTGSNGEGEFVVRSPGFAVP